MIIKRRGAQRDHGEKQVELSNARVIWQAGRVYVKARKVRDFDTLSEHDYEVVFSEEDLTKLFKVLVKHAFDSKSWLSSQ